MPVSKLYNFSISTCIPIKLPVARVKISEPGLLNSRHHEISQISVDQVRAKRSSDRHLGRYQSALRLRRLPPPPPPPPPAPRQFYLPFEYKHRLTGDLEFIPFPRCPKPYKVIDHILKVPL